MNWHWLKHKWSKWEEIEKFKIDSNWGTVGTGIAQERVCLICNKKDIETTKTLLIH